MIDREIINIEDILKCISLCSKLEDCKALAFSEHENKCQLSTKPILYHTFDGYTQESNNETSFLLTDFITKTIKCHS